MSAARQRICAAALSTKRMDDLLGPALDDLRFAIGGGNGAGIYSDVSRVRSALLNAKVAIAKASEIAATTVWPSAEDYDRC